MYFNLKKYNTSGLTYKDDGQILPSKIKDGKIINSNITFIKPYKIQVRASKMINSKRIISKKTLTFTKETTLIQAIEKAQVEYKKMMINIENKPLRSNKLNSSTLFKIAFDKYLDSKVMEHDNDSNKQPYNRRKSQQFFDRWLQPIANREMKDITRDDILLLKSKMKRKNNTHLANRTKQEVHQYITPVFNYYNLICELDSKLDNPAKMQKADRIGNNTREFNLNIEQITALFRELQCEEEQPLKAIWMFLMHGRRKMEVLKLQWNHVNFDKGTYTIVTLNNKARVDMTYTLTPRLKAVLEEIGIKSKGYIFKPNNVTKKTKTPHFAGITLTRAWNALEAPIVLHQLRSCITHYLKNKHQVSNEITGFILGHTQTSTVTERYGTYGHKVISENLNLMLDEIFDDQFSNSKTTKKDKLVQLQLLFPNKTLEELKMFLND